MTQLSPALCRAGVFVIVKIIIPTLLQVILYIYQKHLISNKSLALGSLSMLSLVRKTIAILLRQILTSNPNGARACLRVQNSRFTG